MTREEMTREVDRELANIAKGERGSPQRYLRLFYNGLRRHDLSSPKPRGAKAILLEAIGYLKQEHPYHQFEYNNRFFDLPYI